MTEDDVKKFQGLLDHFKKISEDGIIPLTEKYLLQMLDYALPFFSHLVLTDCFPELERLTINKNVLGTNKRIKEIKFLKYPPAEKVDKYGRCNMKKQSVLYGTFNIMTAFNEMKPRVGDLVTVSTWRVKGDSSLVFCPIFKNQPEGVDTINPRTREIDNLYQMKIKEYPEYMQKQIDALVKFVADAFSKRVSPNNYLDYLFSAYFSDKIFNHFEEGRIEAIYYPSVADGLHFENIAIKPNAFDSKYDLITVKDSVIVTTPRENGNGYLMEGISESKKFNNVSGEIFWDTDKLYQSKERIIQYKQDFGVDIE